MAQKISRRELTKFAKSHAIIIGIDNYQHIDSLLTPKSDAEALKQALIDHQGFEEAHVHTWLDISKQQLEANLAALKAEGAIGKKHCLLFYYAGHGLAGDLDGVGPAGYLMLSDASLFSGELSANESLVRMEWLFDELEAFDSHHTLLILDCCFAGAFRRISTTRGTKNVGLSPMSELRFRRYLEKKAFQVLSSAGPAEKAADFISDRGEQRGLNSPFAAALVKALNGEAQPDFKPPGKHLGDGVLTASELFIYIHDEVERITRSSVSFKPQNPDLFPLGEHDGGQFVFCDPRHPKSQPDWDTREHGSPYKGLKQYEVSDADYYFGRETDIDNIRKIMLLDEAGKKKQERGELSPSLLTITGASGSGKSSLVKAGLLPVFLEEGYKLFKFRPGDRPWSIKAWQDENWQEVLQTTDAPPRFVLPPESEENDDAQAFHFDPQQQQVLYIDQFEEMFTACTAIEREQLDQQLVELLNTAAGQQMKIIISMRSDFEWQLELSAFGQEFWTADGAYYDFYRLYRLIGLGLDDLRSALINPAILFAYEFDRDFEGDLADTILDDLDYLPSALPLLSYTMKEMVDHTSRTERVFERTTYQDTIGGVAGVMSRRMQSIYDDLVQQQEVPEPENSSLSVLELDIGELFKNIYLRMVRLSDGDYSRRRLSRGLQLDELSFIHDKHIVDGLLNHFRSADLITTGASWGVPYDELIHDSLIKNWAKGRQWIDDFGKENLVLQRQLWQAVVENIILPQVAEPVLLETFEFNQLWDTNYKLLNVIEQLSDASTYLLDIYYVDFMNESWELVDDNILGDFKQLWSDWYDQKVFPDLNSIILTGHSASLLRIWLHYGKHGLNRAESAFVMQSWQKRIEEIVALQLQKEELIRNIEKVTNFILEDANDAIYHLEYEKALEKIRSAYETGYLKSEVSKALMELAFFYGETSYKYADSYELLQEGIVDEERKEIALEMANAAANNIEHEEGVDRLLKLSDNNGREFQDQLLQVLELLDPDWFKALMERYYPTMVPVEEGTVGEGFFKEKTTNSFYLAQTAVTVWQYNLFTTAEKLDLLTPIWGFDGDNPMIRCGGFHYTNWLNYRNGLPSRYFFKEVQGKQELKIRKENLPSFRLPTELEWEYAARGGSDQQSFIYSGSNDINEVAWYNRNSNNRTQAVKQKLPTSTRLPLYGMSGQVYEKCEGFRTKEEFMIANPGVSWTNHKFRGGAIIRGGDYRHAADVSEIGNRSYQSWDGNYPDSFRIAVSVMEKKTILIFQNDPQ